MKLRPCDKKLLDRFVLLREHQGENGFDPCMAELCVLWNIKAISNARYVLNIMVRKGWVKRRCTHSSKPNPKKYNYRANMVYPEKEIEKNGNSDLHHIDRNVPAFLLPGAKKKRKEAK